MKTVVILGAMDTKSQDYQFVQALIEEHGLNTLVVDVGVMGDGALKGDIQPQEVAEAGGADLADFKAGDRKDEAMAAMAKGAAVIVRRLYDENRLDGIISMGGGGNTAIGTSAMRAIPIGVPKVMVSTMIGGDMSAYVGTKDITFMPSITDVAGLNRISRRIYANAAGAIAGMVLTAIPSADADEKPLIAASMFGNTTQAVTQAKDALEKVGYEVLVFHATGVGGRSMESLIADGYIAGVLDITTTELADEVCGGVLSAGAQRGWAASRAGIPAVIVPGCVDMANFNGIDSVPAHYRERTLYAWNPNVTLMRTNVEENRQIGEMLARAANESSASAAFVLPIKGVSMLDSEGGRFWDPEADRACFDAIRAHVRAGIPVYEREENINDARFADFCAGLMVEMLGDPHEVEGTPA